LGGEKTEGVFKKVRILKTFFTIFSSALFTLLGTFKGSLGPEEFEKSSIYILRRDNIRKYE